MGNSEVAKVGSQQVIQMQRQVPQGPSGNIPTLLPRNAMTSEPPCLADELTV